MKKLTILLLLAAAPMVNFAQSRSPIRFALKAGGDLSHLTIADNNGNAMGSSSFGLGFYGGGLMEISGPAGSKFKGQIEALFNQQNFKNSSDVFGLKIDKTTKLSQISVPVMVKYFVIPSLSFNLGASVNFNVAGKGKSKTTIDNVSTEETTNLKDNDYLKTLQVGALVGVTYYIYKGLFIDGRYNYYFGKMLDQKTDADPAYKNMSAIQVGVGYKF